MMSHLTVGKLIRMSTDRSKCLSLSGSAGDGTNVVSANCGTGEPAVRWSREGKLITWESNPKCHRKDHQLSYIYSGYIYIYALSIRRMMYTELYIR